MRVGGHVSRSVGFNNVGKGGGRLGKNGLNSRDAFKLDRKIQNQRLRCEEKKEARSNKLKAKEKQDPVPLEMQAVALIILRQME